MKIFVLVTFGWKESILTFEMSPNTNVNINREGKLNINRRKQKQLFWQFQHRGVLQFMGKGRRMRWEGLARLRFDIFWVHKMELNINWPRWIWIGMTGGKIDWSSINTADTFSKIVLKNILFGYFLLLIPCYLANYSSSIKITTAILKWYFNPK